MTYVEVTPGVKIFTQTKGDGEKTLLLVHGWGFSHQMWKLQLPNLAKHYNVVAVDLRGFGNSNKPPNGYDYETWVDDLKVLIETFDLKNITLAGYSLGGALAMMYAAEAPLDKLILIAAAGPRMSWCWRNKRGVPNGLWKFIIPLVEKQNISDLFNQFYTVVFPRTTDEGWLHWIKGMFSSASRTALLSALIELKDNDITKLLPMIDVETKILHGRWDPLVQYGLAEIQEKLIPNATLTTFWHSGHGIFFEEATKLTKELL